VTVTEQLRALRAEHESYPARRAVLVEQARAEGMTWLEIANALGMTQHGLIKSQPDVKKNRSK